MNILVRVLGVLCLAELSLTLESGTIIPLYSYPRLENGGNAWQTLLDAQKTNPITTWAIVNVNNGPGSAVDANYVTAIQQLHAAGIHTLGYVYTGYSRRSQSEVQADINRWKSFYNVEGIFFDEMSYENDQTQVNYYQSVGNFARAQGFTFTVGNPGTATDPKYFDTMDAIMIFEDGTGVPGRDRICSQNTNEKGRTSVSIIPYNVASINAAQINEAKECAGFIYVTDDTLPNPWDTLPNYLTQLFGMLRDSNSAEAGSIIPLYLYPMNNNWQPLFDAHSAYPVPTWAIVNVNSGPGDQLDPNYVTAVQRLRDAGINMLGYVSTRYTERPQSEVQSEINRWKSFYNVQGIFFDEMSNQDDNSRINYYRSVNNYAKSQGFTFTVGNAGTGTDPKYFDTVDNIVIFETDTGFPSKTTLCSQGTNGKGKSSMSIMPYNIGTLVPSQVTDAKDCVGFIYVTNDALPNPWDSLPPYLNDLFRILKG